ncbi:anti-sigma factor domain-containing protein [Nonomuraea sp. NPDC048826]|uniref:anti-sigma factor n=1 Tax=Nonomuraea sp. NPDC048826 TaxID=3364347 RepID=UPI003710AE9A
MDDELHTLSGAYAVHALPPADVAPFEAHLSSCRTCPSEVRRLREAAARLALAVATPPPASLRPRVLATAHARHATLRLPRDLLTPGPPSVTPGPYRRDLLTPGPPSEAPSPYRRDLPGPEAPGSARRGPNGDAPASYASGEDLAETVVLIPRRAPEADTRPGAPPAGDRTLWEAAGPVAHVVPRRRWLGKAAAGLAAVSTAAAVALGVVAFDARRDLGELRAGDSALATEVAAVLAAPDARTVRHRVASGGTGVAVVSRLRGRVLFTSSGMPELPPSKVYALWLMGPDGVRPAGVLDRGADGLTRPVLADLRGDGHLGLTVEPAGGSGRPTTRPILFAELPAA